MFTLSRIAFASAIGLLLLSSGTTKAGQTGIVTVTSTNFVANPPSVNPQGTYSIPLNPGGSWKVQWDYGSINNGVFKQNLNIGVGGSVNIPPAGGNGTWGRSAWKT